jgi:hypothetical protein
MYAVSFYAVAAGQFDRVREVYPRHRAYLDEFARSPGLTPRRCSARFRNARLPGLTARWRLGTCQAT